MDVSNLRRFPGEPEGRVRLSDHCCCALLPLCLASGLLFLPGDVGPGYRSACWAGLGMALSGWLMALAPGHRGRQAGLAVVVCLARSFCLPPSPDLSAQLALLLCSTVSLEPLVSLLLAKFPRSFTMGEVRVSTSGRH